MLIVDMLRHGELQGGVKYRGVMDEPLTPAGRASMDRVWSAVHDDVTRIITSPLSRCAEPAKAWAHQAGIPCEEEAGLQELHYGDWEGMTADEIRAAYPGQLEAWRQDPTDKTPPGGESMRDFAHRVQGVFRRLCAMPSGHVLLVAHSGSIRMLIAHALQAPVVSTRHLAMPYACWSRLHIERGRASLQFHAR